MKILALDIATKTGWATNNPVAQSGMVDFTIGKAGQKMTDAKRALRLLKFKHWLTEFLTMHTKFDLIIYEQQHHRGRAATEVAIGLISEVIKLAGIVGARIESVHSGTLKKFATGHGKAEKAQMIAAAEGFGWKPVDDNEADACLILEYAMKELKGD